MHPAIPTLQRKILWITLRRSFATCRTFWCAGLQEAIFVKWIIKQAWFLHKFAKIRTDLPYPKIQRRLWLYKIIVTRPEKQSHEMLISIPYYPMYHIVLYRMCSHCHQNFHSLNALAVQRLVMILVEKALSHHEHELLFRNRNLILSNRSVWSHHEVLYAATSGKEPARYEQFYQLLSNVTCSFFQHLLLIHWFCADSKVYSVETTHL